ncbi:MAG: hypothetical protein EA372_03805 [Chromatiaceae bacterium]|nr:MAG: hypothetical protein EA372_03805 [Chromatiaceae bacterium]
MFIHEHTAIQAPGLFLQGQCDQVTEATLMDVWGCLLRRWNGVSGAPCFPWDAMAGQQILEASVFFT